MRITPLCNRISELATGLPIVHRLAPFRVKLPFHFDKVAMKPSLLLKTITLAAVLAAPACAWSCDALLGDYTFKQGKSAELRIAKVNGAYVLSQRGQQNAPWSVEATSMRVLTRADLGENFLVELDATSCALSMPGAIFIKTRPGVQYKDSAEDGPQTSAAGFLMYAAQGVVAGIADMYPVPATAN